MTKTKRIKCPADDPTSRALQDALHAVRQHLDMPISYISFFIDEDVVFEEVSCDDAEPLLKTGDRRAAEGTYCQAVLKGYLPQLLPDTGQSEVAQGMTITHQAPIGAVVSVPLKDTNQEIFGMFCCLSPDPRPELTERDHHTMTMFANMA